MKKLLILSIFLSPFVFSAVPSDSKYNTDVTNIFLEDTLNDSTDTPNMILCFMGNVGVDLMLNKGNFKSLVDMNLCDKSGQIANGPQSGGQAAAAAQAAEKSATDYIEVVGNGTRTDNNSPMIGKVWVPNEEDMDGDGTPENMTIYTYTEVTASPSTANPYGVFRMDYTAHLAGNTNVMQGYISSSAAGALTWVDEMNMMGQTLNVKLYLEKTGDNSGKGVVQWPKFFYNPETEQEGMNLYVYSFGFTEAAYCRKQLSKNGGAVDDSNTYCYDTRESQGIKELFQYGLYDSTTGARFELTQGGFPVTTTVSGSKYFGFADYWGLHFPAAVVATFADGTVVTRDMGPGVAGQDYSLQIGGNKLQKTTINHISLNSIDGLSLSGWLNQNNTLGITSSTDYIYKYDKTNDRFEITHARTYPDNSPPVDSKLGTSITFTRANWISEYPNDGISGYVKGYGGLYISPEALADPTSTTAFNAVFLNTNEEVKPADYPETLYCVSNCFTGSSVTAFVNSLPVPGSSGQPLSYGPYTENTYRTGEIAAADLVTYTKNGLNYKVGDTNAVWPTLTDAQTTSIAGSDHRYGSYSGPLVTDLSQFSCPEGHPKDHCEWKFWNSGGSTFYSLRSGYQRWDKKWLLSDSGGNNIEFTEPTQVFYLVPDVAANGDFAGVEVGLDYNAFGSLFGFPGSCYNTNSGVFTTDCQNGNQYFPWISRFYIPNSETAGVVYSGRNQTGTKYLVKQLQGVVFLKPIDNPGITLGDASLLPAATFVDVGPNGGSNYIGAKPVVTDAISVIHGVKQ